MVVSFSTIHAEDKNLMRVQSNAERAFKEIQDCPIINGQFMTNRDGETYFDVTGTMPLYHSLGRMPKGWIVTRNTTVYLNPSEVSMTKTQISFFFSSTGKISIWVF